MFVQLMDTLDQTFLVGHELITVATVRLDLSDMEEVWQKLTLWDRLSLQSSCVHRTCTHRRPLCIDCTGCDRRTVMHRQLLLLNEVSVVIVTLDFFSLHRSQALPTLFLSSFSILSSLALSGFGLLRE